MKKLLIFLAFTFILSFQSFGQQTLCEIYGSTPANLCPLTYGPSIYIAQSLATQYGIAYDEENCSEIRTRKSIQKGVPEIVIYPNPAIEQITIKSAEQIDLVKIFDMNMREIKRSKVLDINISSLPRGLYFVESSFEQVIVSTQKLILIK